MSNTQKADRKAKFLIQALTLPQFVDLLHNKQIEQSRQTLRELEGKVSPEIETQIVELLEVEVGG